MEDRGEDRIPAAGDRRGDGAAELTELPPVECRGSLPELASARARASLPLNNWPLKIQLVPPNAPYLLGASLVIAADCAPFTHPDFHETFLQDRHVLLVACPKFGDAWFHRAKLAQIFSPNEIREVHVVHVAVPCCRGLVRIVREALKDARVHAPLRVTTIGTDGSLVEERCPEEKADSLPTSKGRAAGTARSDARARAATARSH